MAQRFAGKTVLVTGGAAGLGRTIARSFAAEGATLILADIDESGLAETAAELRAIPAQCSTHRVDLSSESEINAFAAQVLAEHDQLDVLVNNAGLAYGEVSYAFETLSQEKWLRFFAINSVAPLLLAQALRPALAKAHGVILNQSSMAANVPATAYGVTKATLNSMTYGMANTFGKDGIRVNAVAPGLMDTPASRAGVGEEHYARIQGMQLIPGHGTAEDIANLYLFLASDDARFINCDIISCDAGNRIRGWRG